MDVQYVGHVFRNNSLNPGSESIKALNSCTTDENKLKGVYLIEYNGGYQCDKQYIGYTNKYF